MNSEAYAEWPVKRRTPVYIYAVKDIMIFLCVIGAFLTLTTAWGVLILTAIGAAAFSVSQGANLESEYLIVSDQLTIDEIMRKAYRRETWKGTMEEVQIVAPSGSYMLKDYERVGVETLDFSSHASRAKTYSLIHRAGINTTKVIFEPNDRVLHRLWMRSPRKVIQQYNSLKF